MPGPRGAPPPPSGHRGRTHAVYIQNADRFSARPLPLWRSRSDSRHRIERMQQAVHSGFFRNTLARSRRRPEWKQRENSAASPGAGRAPDRNRQDFGTPEYERYLPLRSAAIPEKKPQRTPGASVRRTISQRTDCNQLYLWENICDLFIIILFEQPYSFEIRYNRTNLLLFSHYRNQSRYLQILVC